MKLYISKATLRTIEKFGNASLTHISATPSDHMSVELDAAPLANEASKPTPSVEQDERGALIDRLCGQLAAAIHFVSSKDFDKKEALALIDEARAASTSANVAQGAVAQSGEAVCRVCNGHGYRTAMSATGEGAFNETCVYCKGTGKAAPPAQTALTDEQWLELRRIARTYNETGFPKHAREFFAALTAAQSASGDTK